MVALQEVLEDHQSKQDLSSGERECLFYISWLSFQ